ncbi:hypothetical protein KJ359_002012 [Pestalotiopsis sp. 9143b]|nr:hypothetical protein KJ359_002012 [Pestalotiopsis sp. 9143b]
MQQRRDKFVDGRFEIAMELTPTAFISRPIRIVVIGAGISGIQFLKDATTQLQNVSISLYDKNDEEGGTWTENRYPGCACDIPSHAYQYSWNPNPLWTRLYAEAPEILGYIKSTVDSFKLRQYMNFSIRCVGAVWDEDASQWIVTMENTETPDQMMVVKCDVLVSAVDVKSIGNFIRGPTWLVPHVFSKNGEPQVLYDQDFSQKLQDDPAAYHEFRLQIERQLAGSFEGLWAHSEATKIFTSSAESHMRSRICDPATLEALLPTAYKAGCRRFTPADRYMDALNQPNVELIAQPIERVEVQLSDVWSDEGGYQSYLAATVADFPNFFVFNPPICPVNGSAYPGIERASEYMIKVIDRLQKDRLKSVSVKPSAQAAFTRWVQSRMPEMVWSEAYKRPNGKVIVPWPGTILHYYAATEFVRWEEYDLVFEEEDQKCASFGNGVTIDGFKPEQVPWLRRNND